MAKAFMIGGIAILAVVIAIALYAATKPDIFRVARSTTIQAPPDPMISDLRNFPSWSPYETKDPAMRRTYSGPETGKGAVYEWDGDKNVGKGSLEIADLSPPSKVTLNLNFVRPFEAHNIVEFTLVPHGAETDVTWSMQGPTPFLAKILHVFVDMDHMVGQDFETGLAKLKALAEKPAGA